MDVKRVVIEDKVLRIDFTDPWAESFIVANKVERERILEGLKTTTPQEYFKPWKLECHDYHLKGAYCKIVKGVK